jgi:hypothetical protein
VNDKPDEDPFDGLRVATCPRGLTMMDVAGTDDAPYWHRAHVRADSNDGLRRTAAVKPTQIADELGYSPKTLRAYLREQYGDEHTLGNDWDLTPAQEADLRKRFSERG